jgi:hypothetical protein
MTIQELVMMFQISMMLNTILVFAFLFFLAIMKPVLPYFKGKVLRRPVVAVWGKDNEVRFEVAKVEDETYNTKRYSWFADPVAVGRLGGVKFAIGLPELAFLIPPRLAKKASVLSKLGIAKEKLVKIKEGKLSVEVPGISFDGGEVSDEVFDELRSFVNPRDLVKYIVQSVSAREFRIRVESAKLDVKLERLKTMDVMKAAVAVSMILAVLFAGYLLIKQGAVQQAAQVVQNTGTAIDQVTNVPINVR